MKKVYGILLQFRSKQISLTECEKQLNDYFFIKKVEKIEIFDKNICEFKDYCKYYRCVKSCRLAIKALKNDTDEKFPA